MKIFIETERLILRELVPSDDTGIYKLDADPEVHRYLGGNPITTIEQAQHNIAFIREQYVTNGIGRWAVIEKASGDFIGWAGLKLIHDIVNHHTNFHDVGYRFMPEYWGKGYATECAIATVAYGFEQMGLQEMYGITDTENYASRRVLEKAGLQFVETFDYGKYGVCNWLEIKK